MSEATKLRVAIDLTQVDNQSLGSGQFRYAADLVRALCALGDPLDLILFGSTEAPAPEFRTTIEQFPAQCRYVRFRPYRGRGYYYFDVARLAWWLVRHRPDVFHQIHTNIPPVSRGAVVVTVHHYLPDAALFSTRPHRYYRWALGHRADVVIAVSDATRDDAHRHFGVPFARLRTVYHGLSPSLAAVPQPRAGAPYVLSPYNLSAPKNLRALIEAWPAIAGCEPALQLILFGRAQISAGAEEEFDRRLRTLPHADRIVRTGHVSDDALARLYEGCALFVFPSTVEGFGYPLLEAMAHGACCIARDASAMREVGGDAVCLVETLRAEEIARAAVDLLADATRRRELGERARYRAQRFTVEAMARGTLECYRAAVRARVR